MQRLTWAIQAGTAGHSPDTETMTCGEASTVQDGWPGVTVAGHDGSTAGLHSLTQAAARVDDPAGEGGVVTSRTQDQLEPALCASGCGC